MKKLNIGVGKLGSSTLFDTKRWSAHGGCMDSPTMIKLLAKYNPEHTFYIIGRSDFSRLKPEQQREINVNGNIIDPWKDYTNAQDRITFLTNWFDQNNVKLDTAALYPGPVSRANIPNMLRTVKTGEYAKVLFCFENYVGPVIDFLNKSMVKYFTLVPDPRYHAMKAWDCFNIAEFALSQYNSDAFNSKHITSYEDHTYINTKIKTIYSGIETLFLTEQQKLDITSMKKTIPMTIVLNEGGNNGLCRGPMLKDYILNHVNDVKVYGKWDEKWLADSRFKGPVHINLLAEELKATKSTFIIPIQKGWVTAKFWEMSHYGIIPFMHPYYDEQGHIKCHELIRTKSPADFKEKYKLIMNDSSIYNEVMESQQKLLANKYYNGQFINNVVMRSVYHILGEDPANYNLTTEKINEINNSRIIESTPKNSSNSLENFF